VTIGDDGFIGSGGGARSGSELSHLSRLPLAPHPTKPGELLTWAQLLVRHLMKQNVDVSNVSRYRARRLVLSKA
jgi:3-polyprenyl-4-hydroxybenzoate decarboxylase